MAEQHLIDAVIDVAADEGLDLRSGLADAIVEAVLMDLETGASPAPTAPPPAPRKEASVDAQLMWRELTGQIQDLRRAAGRRYLKRHEIYPEPKGVMRG